MANSLMEEFVVSAREFTDVRIMNTINQSYNYSKEKVEAARVVALERKLISEEGMSSMNAQHELMKNAKSMLEEGKSVDLILSILTARGATPKDAEFAIHEASKVANLNKPSAQVLEEEKSSQWYWYVFGAFVVIRIILRTINN